MSARSVIGDESSPVFESVLFESGRTTPGVDQAEEPDFFGDLNLDQVLESMTAGREEYRLRPFFYTALRDVATVRYRHQVLHDLETATTVGAVRDFAEAMRRMREHLGQAAKLRYVLQKQAWFLDAVEIYCFGVRSFSDALAGCDVHSAGLRDLRDYLAAYVGSAPFNELVDETQALKDGLAAVRYELNIRGPKVTVSNYDNEPDYSVDVDETFAKFKRRAAKSYLAQLNSSAEMNHIETQILGLVARLNPELFDSLASYCAARSDYVDQTVARFDREVQFFLAYLEFSGRFRAAGLSFCYPRVSTRSKELRAEETFDLALANKLVAQGGVVVGNDLYLEGPERIFVVTGPNNGGKTTFARLFGQLHYLASLGLPVPGRNARLHLPDRIYTHFEREEDIETLRGKLEDELVRVHEILGKATGESVIVMNESFSSTTLNDALVLGTEVLHQLIELGSLGIYVTFVDELASLSASTVSAVSTVAPDKPAERTFKIVRQPADGLAYASALADKYGLSYARLKERIGA